MPILAKDFAMDGKVFRLNYLRAPSGDHMELPALDALCPVFPAGYPNRPEMECFLREYEIPGEWPNLIIPHGHLTFRQRARRGEPLNVYWQRTNGSWRLYNDRDTAPLRTDATLVLIARERLPKPKSALREKIPKRPFDH